MFHTQEWLNAQKGAGNTCPICRNFFVDVSIKELQVFVFISFSIFLGDFLPRTWSDRQAIQKMSQLSFH